jgi:transposase
MKNSPELVTMSVDELDRMGVIRRVVEGRLPQKQAAVMMGVTARQARRFIVAYKLEGAAALVSKKRGRPGNRRKPADVKERALALVRDLYADFGPTLAAEKLAELHDLVVSRETLRHWMRAIGLWATRKDRAPAPHQPRFRRAAFGELVQIDGSEHHGFEDRGPYCKPPGLRR